MNAPKTKTKTESLQNVQRKQKKVVLETLESRALLSAAADTGGVADITVRPNLTLSPAASSSSFTGLTPAQIRKAYGFDGLTLSNSVKGDGSGQTIAIVDAFRDPNIASDLATFDSKFNLGSANLKVDSQTGGSTSSYKTDGGWSLETALDVEWAHAIAPKANILLVESKDDSLNNLLAAVDTARKASGVSVVSMSWGAGEFWGETSLDSHFTTPSGHNGVTFVAASGDSGSWFGTEWPAVSPKVLAVGGTTLSLKDSSGTYGSETGWSDSTGGFSQLENEPGYQFNVQNTGARTSPDVSYNADPNSGFAVFSSVSFEGVKGWQVVGGTSAGAPQWAALVAIADQGRKLVGKSTLNGATGTLPAIYALDKTSSVYAANFRDVTRGSSSFFASAFSGYDLVTGLGSPKAKSVVAALIATGTSSAAKTSTSIASKTTTTTSKAAAALLAAESAVQPVGLHNVPTAQAAVQSTMSSVSDVKTIGPATSEAAVASGVFNSGGVVRAGGVRPAGTREWGGLYSDRSIRGGAGAAASVSAAASAAAHALAVARESLSCTAASVSRAIADLAAPATSSANLFDFAHFGNPLNLAADSIAAFADESATLAAATAGGVAGSRDRAMAVAWTVTGVVAAADAALLVYYFSGRDRKRAAEHDALEPWPGGDSERHLVE